MAPKSLSIKKIKEDLKSGNISSSILFLKEEENLEKIFKIFKEQRLLLIPEDFLELEKKYLNVFKEKCSNPNKFEIERNYIQFLNIYRKINDELRLEIKNILADFKHLTLKNFFFITNIYMEEYFDEVSKEIFEKMKKRMGNLTRIEDKANVTQAAFNEQRGKINDAIFQQLNLVNVFSEILSENSNKVDVITKLNDKDEEKLIGALNLSGQVNCLRYVFDKVSYGEWEVSKVSSDSAGTNILEFSIIDYKLEKAREMGLQRILSDKIRGGKSQRWLKRELQESFLKVFKRSWHYYQEKYNLSISDRKYYNASKKMLLKSLDDLDAEDELLVGVPDDDKIFSHYLVAGTLLSLAYASHAIKETIPKLKYQFTYTNIPYEIIRTALGKFRFKRKMMDLDVLECYLKSLPLRNSLDLVNSPFIKQKDGVLAVHHLMLENWTNWVRVNLMKGGATANTVGKTWEKYIASIFKKNNWSVGQGVKLKKDGKVITDIDVLAKRKDLLLVIQIKIYYGTGVDTFEQWKFRKKLEHGVEQVKKSKKVIQSNPHILKNHLFPEVLGEIREIKALVVTNAHYFNGWVKNNIPIVSTGSLMQIFSGANVTFTSANNTNYESKNYAKSRNLTNKEFIDFLEKPLDWRIGNQDIKVNFQTQKFKNTILKLPFLET